MLSGQADNLAVPIEAETFFGHFAYEFSDNLRARSRSTTVTR